MNTPQEQIAYLIILFAITLFLAWNIYHAIMGVIEFIAWTRKMVATYRARRLA